MIQHVKQLANEFADVTKTYLGSESFNALLEALNEELAKLDTRDFSPLVRYEFTYGRKLLLRAERISKEQIPTVVEAILENLDHYGGEGSRAVSRSFDFVTNSELRAIIERDYRELSLILFPAGAWKSTVVAAGSILEAILFDLLTVNASQIKKSEAAVRAPKKKSGVVKSLAGGEWNLVNLIDVAAELKLLPQEREKTIDQTLRDYRNFIHPRKEIRAAHPVSEAEALAKGALDGICNFLAGKGASAAQQDGSL